jgi:hypothetical protein
VSSNIRSDVILRSITRVRDEAELGLTEIRRLHSEGRTADVGPEMRQVLEAIRNTAMFDVNDEYHTLLGKLGAGPVNDFDAKGPPSVNARFIVEWLASDLAKLHELIRRLRAIDHGKSTPSTASDYSLLVTLLEAVGSEMLQAHAALHDELRPLLDTQSGV